MFRRLLILAALVVVLAGAYVSAPLYAAWQIREAVRANDTATLERKVDWVSVRASLKTSLAEARLVLSEAQEATGEARPSVWQRLKAAALPYVTDPLIDRYMRPEGIGQLYQLRQRLAAQAAAARRVARAGTTGAGSRTPDPAPEPPGTFERARAVAKRIERLAFVSPTRVEIEMADQIVAGRTWIAALELRGLAWQLTELRIIKRPVRGLTAPAVRAARAV